MLSMLGSWSDFKGSVSVLDTIPNSDIESERSLYRKS